MIDPKFAEWACEQFNSKTNAEAKQWLLSLPKDEFFKMLDAISQHQNMIMDEAMKKLKERYNERN